MNAPTFAEAEAGCMDVQPMALDAARRGDVVALASLLAAGIPINLRDGKGNTLLMLASHHAHLEAARLLLERGADPERQNLRHQTPLGRAAFKGNLEMARLLVEYGADPSADQGGRLPIQCAALLGHGAIVRYLEAVTRKRSLPLRGLSWLIARLKRAFRGSCQTCGKHFIFVGGA